MGAVATGGGGRHGAEAAAFADRSALQTALFGCVGACNDVRGSGDETYCNNNGPWTSGTGAGCHAGSTHGAIDAWNVSRVTSMNRSEFGFGHGLLLLLLRWFPSLSSSPLTLVSSAPSSSS